MWHWVCSFRTFNCPFGSLGRKIKFGGSAANEIPEILALRSTAKHSDLAFQRAIYPPSFMFDLM